MNKFGTSSDDKISLPEQIEIIKDALINSSNLRWDDYYWAAKFLFQNDEEGRTDNLIIESLENALVSGLNVYSNKEHFLDASRILAQMYFKYKSYRKAENNLMLIREIETGALPDWVFLYSATTTYKIDLMSSVKRPDYLFSNLNKIRNTEDQVKRQLLNIIKDFLNDLTKFAYTNPQMLLTNLVYKELFQHIQPYYQEVYKEWNNFLQAMRIEEDGDIASETNNENFDHIRIALIGKIEEQAERIDYLEDLLDEVSETLRSEICNLAKEISQFRPLEDDSRETTTEIEMCSTASATEYAILGRKPKILVFGASQVPAEHLRGIAKNLGLEKNQIEFMTDYEQNKRFDFDNIRYNSPYGSILIGPNAHCMVGVGDHASVIQKLTKEEGFPHIEEIRTETGELKITKTSFKSALSRAVVYLSSIGIEVN